MSHRAAAARLELLSSSGRAELTVRSGRRGRQAFLVHRTAWLPTSHVVELDGLPVTSVARTLLDLGAVVPPRRVEQAFDKAEIMRVLDLREIERLLAEAGPRPGTAALRAVLGRETVGSTLTDSWPAERLIVEADGAGAHATRRGHAHDTRRDVLLTNAGWTLLRFAYDAIVHDARYVQNAIRMALASRRR